MCGGPQALNLQEFGFWFGMPVPLERVYVGLCVWLWGKNINERRKVRQVRLNGMKIVRSHLGSSKDFALLNLVSYFVLY